VNGDDEEITAQDMQNLKDLMASDPYGKNKPSSGGHSSPSYPQLNAAIENIAVMYANINKVIQNYDSLNYQIINLQTQQNQEPQITTQNKMIYDNQLYNQNKVKQTVQIKVNLKVINQVGTIPLGNGLGIIDKEFQNQTAEEIINNATETIGPSNKWYDDPVMNDVAGTIDSITSMFGLNQSVDEGSFFESEKGFFTGKTYTPSEIRDAKVNTIVLAAAIGEAVEKKIIQVFGKAGSKAGKEVVASVVKTEVINEVIAGAEIKYAPALESGLTRKLQDSIVGALDEGDFIGIRSRPYQANFLDGKYPAKPSGADVVIKRQNGVRVLSDKTKVVSDLDTAFITKNGISVDNSTAYDIYGKRINKLYGNDVVMHGDNYNGVLKNVDAALEVESKNGVIYIFNKNGFVESGKYQDMINKYIPR
jgi:hypothetical protein